MSKNKTKIIVQSLLACTFIIALANCAWAAFNNDLSKLALELDSESYSVYDKDGHKKTYLEDGEKYIIDANDPEAENVPTNTRLTGNIQLEGDSKKVSLSLRDADVRQVIRMIADKAGLNVVFHSSAEGEVTLDLKDVDISTALEFILDSCELAYIKEGKNIMIASKDDASKLSSARQSLITIPIKYVSARMISQFLNKNIFNGRYPGVSTVPIAAVNGVKNEIMLFGTSEDETIAKKLIAKLDVKPMVNMFPVNHVTPAEMAGTICDTILQDRSDGSNTSTSVSAETREAGGDDPVELGGGYIVCVAGAKDGSIDLEDSDELSDFTSTPLTVAFFPQLGTIATYGGSKEQVKTIESFIKLHDKKQPMAYIELSLIQLSESGSKQFNTDWSVWTPFGEFMFNDKGFQTNPYKPIFLKGATRIVYDTSSLTPTEDSTIVKPHGWGPIVMSLNYLISNGKARVLASPKIMVTNGKKSTIDLTSDYVKSVVQQFDTSSTTAVAQTTYEIGSDQGIKVEITPFISPEGYVVMNLKPDYTTIKEQVQNYTLLARRNIELEAVRVKDGETLVLAGMIQEDERQTTTKMPVLGDLPVVGTFFRRNINNTSKEELVILITPHIVYSKDQIDRIKAADKL